MRALAFALSFALLPLAAAAEERPLTLPGDTEVTDSATGTRFRLTGVTDQRCPAGVACYWEGMMRLEISVTPAQGQPQTVILCNICDDGDRTAIAAGLEIQLATLTPSTDELARKARLPVLQDYSAGITLLDRTGQ